MLRVLMAVPNYPYPVVGGLERQSHELSKALGELGIAVQAVSYQFADTQSTEEVVEGVPVHRMPWSDTKHLRFLRTPVDLFRLLYGRRRTYDLVHLHQYSWFGMFVILTARLLRKPVLMKLPSVGAHSLPGVADARFGSLKLAIFRMTDAVVAMSTESLGELDAIGFPRQRVLRCPNGIRMRPDAAAATRDGDSSGMCRVVFVGRLSGEKRIDDLLHAWQKVVASASGSVELQLWGSGPAEAEMKALAASLGIGDSVIFRGHVEDVRAGLEAMDVFVLTSTVEGNSNAILEAMAAGLPVVSTRVGGTPMQVGDDGARWLITPGDRDGLYARLLELVEDPALRRRVGDLMRERILEHFEISRVAATYAAAYRLIAAGQRDRVWEAGNPVIAD